MSREGRNTPNPKIMMRRRDRDRDREDRGYGERDRDRDYRERDRERSQSSSSPATVQGPVLQILKRPGASTSSSSAISSSTASQSSQPTLRERETTLGSGLAEPAKTIAPTVILQRSSHAKRTESTQDLHSATSSTSHHDQATEKPKLSGQVTISDMFKLAYKFPCDHAIPLIENSLKMKVDVDFITANKFSTDFFVVTTIGMPLAGKSTILSFLAGDETFGARHIFKSRKKEQQKECSVYMPSDQILFIEMASVFNGAAACDLIPYVAQQGTLETAAVTFNLRMMRWALLVSHVVLVVSESIIDPNLFQLINSAEMIHPIESALGDGAYPELLYVCNKAPLSYLDDEPVRRQVQAMFNTVTGRAARIKPNFYILPHIKGGYDFDKYDELKKKIYEFNRYNRAPFAADIEGIPKFVSKVTMQEWFNTASKSWEEMNQPNFFASYVKLLP